MNGPWQRDRCFDFGEFADKLVGDCGRNCDYSVIESGGRAVVRGIREFGRTVRSPFPDAENSIITPEKLCDYLLNPMHPVGGPKANWFSSLGYTRENWEILRDDLLEIARSADQFIAKSSPFGVKYEVQGEIGCEGRRPGCVVTVWIVEANAPPRLVTAYPGSD